jgi:hypothetical protein
MLMDCFKLQIIQERMPQLTGSAEVRFWITDLFCGFVCIRFVNRRATLVQNDEIEFDIDAMDPPTL